MASISFQFEKMTSAEGLKVKLVKELLEEYQKMAKLMRTLHRSREDPGTGGVGDGGGFRQPTDGE